MMPRMLRRDRDETAANGRARTLRSRGTYRFLRLIGRGGMGEVWLVEKEGYAGFNKLMAIKTIRKSKLRDARSLEMFLDEARLVANLLHHNIVQVYQLGRTWREVFIVMEHVFGVTLLQILERLQRLGQPMSVEFAAYVGARICHGLHYAHNKRSREGVHLQIVHRDICPSNIMVSFRGIPKLSDFGVAKASTSTVDDEGNVVWGKYPYMAPEAVRRQGTDHRSDIYSLGLVLSEVLTGHVAHDADSTMALTRVLSRETDTDRDVRRLREDVPEPLAKVLAKACHPDPDRRFQTAKQMADELETFLLGHFLFPSEDRLAEWLMGLFPNAAKHRWW